MLLRTNPAYVDQINGQMKWPVTPPLNCWTNKQKNNSQLHKLVNVNVFSGYDFPNVPLLQQLKISTLRSDSVPKLIVSDSVSWPKKRATLKAPKQDKIPFWNTVFPSLIYISGGVDMLYWLLNETLLPEPMGIVTPKIVWIFFDICRLTTCFGKVLTL